MPKTQYEPLEDCFGYRRGGCVVLREALCMTCGRCAFYKTGEQAQADTARSLAQAAERGYYAAGGKYTPRDRGDG